MARAGYVGGPSGRGGGRGYDAAYAAAAAAGPFGPYAAGGGRGGGAAGRGAYWGPEAYMGYMGYSMGPPGAPMGPGAYYAAAAAAAAATAPPAMFPRGRGGFFPGGRNWAGARPPPPGQPGFSSGLQVGVMQLPQAVSAGSASALRISVCWQLIEADWGAISCCAARCACVLWLTICPHMCHPFDCAITSPVPSLQSVPHSGCSCRSWSTTCLGTARGSSSRTPS
jgi:hypothetical protein